MNKKTSLQQVSLQIRAGNTQAAIRLFQQLSISPNSKKTLSIIEAELQQVNQKELKGIVNSEEIQISRNRINDKLITLIYKEETSAEHSLTYSKKLNLSIILMVILAVLMGWLGWRWYSNAGGCPSFSTSAQNKILLIPFDNVGNQEAKPHTVLRDRINQLTQINNLSSEVKIGRQIEEMTITMAPDLAKTCAANMVVWGNYSATGDSLRLILQYYFSDHPDWANLGELVVLKDVTALQHGKMLKGLDDSILSLCGIIATRKGDLQLAQKWLTTVHEPDIIDLEMLEVIRKIEN